MPTSRPPSVASAGRPTRGGAAAVLAALLATAGCAGSPRAADRARPVADPERRGDPAAPPTVAAPAPAPAPDGLPAAPPPGTPTSDRGSRLARPTPLGQLAPEDAPAVTPTR